MGACPTPAERAPGPADPSAPTQRPSTLPQTEGPISDEGHENLLEVEDPPSENPPTLLGDEGVTEAFRSHLRLSRVQAGRAGSGSFLASPRPLP